jgi:hypothetical protein
MSNFNVYKTFYWSPILITIKDYFISSTNLYNFSGDIVGSLLLTARSDNSSGELALDEDFSFLFDDGSLNFTIGFNQLRFSNIRNGNYGNVPNKSGIYTDINDIKYYFEFDNETNLWKITFKFESK